MTHRAIPVYATVYTEDMEVVFSGSLCEDEVDNIEVESLEILGVEVKPTKELAKALEIEYADEAEFYSY